MATTRIPSVEGGIQPTLLTTKGDIIAATAASTVSRLAVGADDTAIVADSTQSTGLAYKTKGVFNGLTTTGDTIYSSSGTTQSRLGIGSTGQVLTVASGVPSWATPSSGGMTAISTGTLSSTGVTFSSISGYTNLQLSISGFNAGGNRLLVRVNGDSGANYTGGYVRQRDGLSTVAQYANSPGQSTSIITDGDVTPDSGATNSVTFTFFDYVATTGAKVIQANGYALSTYKVPALSFYSYNGTAGAITSITIAISGGTFSAGTYTLYGVK